MRILFENSSLIAASMTSLTTVVKGAIRCSIGCSDNCHQQQSGDFAEVAARNWLSRTGRLSWFALLGRHPSREDGVRFRLRAAAREGQLTSLHQTANGNAELRQMKTERSSNPETRGKPPQSSPRANFARLSTSFALGVVCANDPIGTSPAGT